MIEITYGTEDIKEGRCHNCHKPEDSIKIAITNLNNCESCDGKIRLCKDCLDILTNDLVSHQQRRVKDEENDN